MPHHHHHFLHFLRNRELNELYASIVVKSFALSLIGIFIPIYLLQSGLPLASVFLFFAIFSGTHAIISIPAAKISSRFGFKHSILFSIPFLILALLGLYLLDVTSWVFYAVPIFFGIQNGLFWIGFHVDFARFSDKKNRGSEVGFVKVLGVLFHVAGPVAGGIILTFVGFKVLFVAVSGLLVLSAVPLFLSKDIHNPTEFSFRGIFKGRKIKDGLSFVGFGIERAVGYVIWPIFIFFTILSESYTTLGFVTSLALVFSAVFIFIVGKFSDNYRKLMLKIGSIMNSVVWVVKSFVKTVTHVFVIDAFYGISQVLMNVSFDTICYDRANKDDIVKFMVFREFVINAGRSAFFVVMIFVADLVSSFIFGGSLGSLLLFFF
jgi:MFS family permease